MKVLFLGRIREYDDMELHSIGFCKDASFWRGHKNTCPFCQEEVDEKVRQEWDYLGLGYAGPRLS